MIGWISIHRQIQDHWLWKDKPFDKRSAWIDMLLMANHDDNRFLLGNELVEVKRGSFITSELKLMDRWGWSKTKVRAFLNLLQNDSMIEKISDKKKTTIIIEKYSDYQDTQTTKEPQKNHKETTKEPQKDTNNNDNNVNKVNKEIYSVLDNYSTNDNLRQALKDFIEMRKKIKSPMSDKAFQLLLSKLDTMTATDDIKIQLLEQSILNSWKSVFPLKQEQQIKQTQKKPANKFHNFTQSDDVDFEAMAEQRWDKLKEKFNKGLT